MAKSNTAKDNTADDNFQDVIPANKLPLVVALAAASRLADDKKAFLYIEEADANALKELGFAKVAEKGREGSTDVNGRIAARLTDEGLAYADKLSGIEPASEYTNEAGPSDNTEGGTTRQTTGFKRPDTIEIEEGVALPSIARGRTGETSYPFDKLPLNGSFHIAATPACPDPSKSVASSVSAANLKYSEEEKDSDGNVITETKRVRQGTGANKKFIMKDFPKRKPTRQFTVRSVGVDDPKGAGCRVWRIL